MLTLSEPDLAALLATWRADGWARVGLRAPTAVVASLAARADQLMTDGAPGLFFQHDAATGAYDDLDFGAGWIGPSPRYRKIEGLERDPVFRAWIDNPLFAQLAAAVIGEPVALSRAVLWCKAPALDAGPGGTELPWHQDGGPFWGLSAQPPLTLWTALDDTPVTSGCLEVLAGTHHGGLATPAGGTVPAALVGDRRGISVPAIAGEILLIDNLVWHRSGRNHTAAARRALSVTVMPATVRCTRRRRAPRQFVGLYGTGGSTSVPTTAASTLSPRE